MQMKGISIILVVFSLFIFNGTPGLCATGTHVPGTGENVEAAAQETHELLKLSLKKVQELAAEHSIVTQNARLDVKMAKKKIWETTTIGLPQISASVDYRNDLQLATTLIPAQFFDPDAAEGETLGVQFGTKHNATAQLKVDQLIFSGSYIVALRASKIYLRLSQEAQVKSEIEVKQAVTDTYYLILLAEQSRKTLAANLENVKKTRYETVEMFKAGFVEDTDADQLQLTVTELENAVKSMDRQIKVTYNLLKFQMGLDLHRPIALTGTLESILAEIDKNELLTGKFILSNHIDYRMADANEISMKLLMQREVSEYLPTISAFASHTRMAMRNSFNFFKKNDEQWFQSSMIGISIKIPIFSTGMRAARVAQAKMDLRKARNTKKQVTDGLKLELLQARSAFSDACDTSDSTKKNVELAKRIYDKTQEKYKQGTASSLQLTQVHSQYLTAEDNYTRAVVELLKAKTRLDKALNRL